MRIDLTKWRLYLKLTGWWQPVIGFGLLGVFFLIRNLLPKSGDPAELMYIHRVIETIVPLLFAMQAAYLLGPDNEPALELLLSYPSRLPGLFMERLKIVGVLHLAVALVATLTYAIAWNAESPFLAIIRWLTAGIVLGGVAVFTTQVTRQSIFGVLITTLLWAASLYGGDGILKKWPWFWPFHIYLQPEKLGMEIYLFNRLILIGAGLILLLLSLKLLNDEDSLLGVR
jgi:hypothetical protein